MSEDMSAPTAELVVHEEAPITKVAMAMSLADIQATAKAIVASRMFTGVENENVALVKILAGQELGLGPVASVNGLYVLNGKIGMMASVAGALLQKHGYTWVAQWDDVDTPTSCEITFFHSSLPADVGWTSRFTVGDAIRAKLVKPDGAHQKYPKDMLYNRAFMSGARKVAPSVLLNMGYEYDELKEAAPYNPSLPKPASAPASVTSIPIVQADTIDCPLHPGTEARLNRWGSAYSHPTSGKTADGKTVWCNTKIDKKAISIEGEVVGDTLDSQSPASMPTGAKTPIVANRREPSTIKSIAELLNACFKDFGLQPKDVCKELGVGATGELTMKPSECYTQIRGARE